MVTFHDTNPVSIRLFSLLAAVSISSLVRNPDILDILAGVFALRYLSGNGVAIGVSILWNYLGESRLTCHEH